MLIELHNNLKEISKKWFQHIKYKSEIENNEDITWYNDFFINPSVRYGHLEYFRSNNGKIEVLHSTFFPSYFKNLPIYGFDVIALNNIVTGIFCDFTNCLDENPFLTKSLKEIKNKYKDYERKLPEWANFFSKDFICIAPKDLNKEELIKDFIHLFELYVMQAEWCNTNCFYHLSRNNVLKSIETQNQYSINQRKNDKTFKALSAYIGSDKAREFIDTVLFPIYQSNAA
jgi:hypothetical protein